MRVDLLREILADKLTAFVSRSELSDLVDLYFLKMSGCELLAAIPDARAKDGGREANVVTAAPRHPNPEAAWMTAVL